MKPDQSQMSAEELIRFVENLKRQWMKTLDSLVDPLVIVDQDFRIEKLNKAFARAVGTDVKSLVGQSAAEVLENTELPKGTTLSEKIDLSKTVSFEIQGQRERYYEVSAQPLDEEQTSPSPTSVIVFRDRTNAKRMQEQLMTSEKLASIGLLAGGVAHEINNPLGGILIFSQMLLKEMDQQSPHYQDVVEIEAATQRCKAIVESLLDFARQRPAAMATDEEADVVEAIESALRFGKVGMKGQGNCTILAELGNAPHPIKGDRNKLIQVFLNLIQNAVQAMPDGGSLRIHCAIEQENGKSYGVYKVQDTGIGISKSDLGKIFDPFFTTKDPGQGTGLGLALSYGIVQDLGGQMRCESTINVGTTFEIRLPLAMAKRVPRGA